MKPSSLMSGIAWSDSTWASKDVQREDASTRASFVAFVLFTVVVFFAPQAFIPGLEAIHIGRLTAGLALGMYFLTAVSQGRLFLVYRDEIKLVLLLLAISILTVPFSSHPGGSLEYILDLFIKSVIVYVLAANLLTSETRFRTLCWLFATSAIFNGAIGFQQFLSGEFIAATNRISGSLTGLTANPNDLSLFLNLALPFVVYLYAATERKILRFACLAAMVLSVATIVVSLSRAGFLTLCAMGILFTLRKVRSQGFFPVIVAGLLIVVVIALAPAGYGHRIISIWDTSQDETGSASGRILGMEAALSTMLHHPLGTGIGMNILSHVESGLGWNVVHNTYLQIGVELGIPGLLVYLLLLGKTWANLRRIRLGRPQTNGRLVRMAESLEIALVGFCVAAFFYPVAYHFYFYYIGGMAFALKHLEGSQSPEQEAQQTKTARLPVWKIPVSSVRNSTQ